MGHQDAFANVLVSARGAPPDKSTSQGTAAYGALRSNGTRQLNSPLVLVHDDGAASVEYAGAVRALVGRFSGTTKPYADLVALGGSDSSVPRAWSVPGAKDAAFTPTSTALDLHGALGPDFDIDCARFAAGDIDGDGRDETVAVFGHAICGAPVSKLAVGRAEADQITFDVRALAVPGDADRAVITLSDLDGDGSDDLALARRGSAAVFWGGASGLAEVPSLVKLPAKEQVVGMTPIARSGQARGASRIAVLTDASVIALSADAYRKLDVTSLISKIDAQALRSADVDGDGLGDLLLSTVDGLDVRLGVPAPPLGGTR
jgi:hypothetical protein